jgi:hypothetical protein
MLTKVNGKAATHRHKKRRMTPSSMNTSSVCRELRKATFPSPLYCKRSTFAHGARIFVRPVPRPPRQGFEDEDQQPPTLVATEGRAVLGFGSEDRDIPAHHFFALSWNRGQGGKNMVGKNISIFELSR